MHLEFLLPSFSVGNCSQFGYYLYILYVEITFTDAVNFNSQLLFSFLKLASVLNFQIFPSNCEQSGRKQLIQLGVQK